MPRKIIQISNGMALTNDGNVYQYISATPSYQYKKEDGTFHVIKSIAAHWSKLPDIPQDGYIEEDSPFVSYFCSKRIWDDNNDVDKENKEPSEMETFIEHKL